jgi:hypothetical protein
MRVPLTQIEPIPKNSRCHQRKETTLDNGRRIKNALKQRQQDFVGQDSSDGDHKTENGNNECVAGRSLPVEGRHGNRIAQPLGKLLVNRAAFSPALNGLSNDAVLLFSPRPMMDECLVQT